MNEKLVFNFLIDQLKKKIDKFERAKLVREYLNKTGVSARQLARNIGVGKTTLVRWLCFEKISKKQFDELIDAGLTPSHIERHLTNKGSLRGLNPLNDVLYYTVSRVRKYAKKRYFDKETKKLLDDFASIFEELYK